MPDQSQSSNLQDVLNQGVSYNPPTGSNPWAAMIGQLAGPIAAVQPLSSAGNAASAGASRSDVGNPVTTPSQQDPNQDPTVGGSFRGMPLLRSPWFPGQSPAAPDQFQLAQQLLGRADSAKAQGDALYENQSEIARRMGATSIPQMQPLRMNPWAALATLGTAGLLQNRFVPQAQEFAGNLLGGLQQQHEQAYQNQQAAYQAHMGQLQASLQAAKDQGSNLYNLSGGLTRDASTMVQWANRASTNLQIAQGRDQSMLARFGANSATREALARMKSSDTKFKDITDSFNRAAGPDEREMWFKVAQEQFPQYFAGSSMDQFAQSVRDPTPKERAQDAQGELDRQKAGYVGMEGWRLNGLPNDQAQYWHQRAVGSTDAAIKALGDARVDPLVRQGIVDRVTLLEPDYRARYATALAQMAELTPHAEGPNALKAYQALLVNARQRQSIVVGQLNQLARENGGELPMKGDAAPTVAMLWQELNGAPHAGTQGITHELNHYAQQIRKLQTGGVGGTG